ncbi:MAG: hypothetical protein HUU29_06455 [Planctomycetaceae bacterium]|nr:hypothetical protein [Planctomycetaceae bacterium]
MYRNNGRLLFFSGIVVGLLVAGMLLAFPVIAQNDTGGGTSAVKLAGESINHIAMELNGTWVLDKEQTKEFGGWLAVKEDWQLTLKSTKEDQDAALGYVRALYDAERSAGTKDSLKTVYCAGTFKFPNKEDEGKTIEGFYALISRNGNPALLMIDAEKKREHEAVYLSIARHVNGNKDILYFGGDRIKESFNVFKRKQEEDSAK